MSGNTSYTSIGGKSPVAVAVNAAAKAGEWIRTKLGDVDNLMLKTSAHDLVTEVDKGAELLIRNLLKTYFPEHAFLGEESVPPGVEASRQAIERLKDEEYLWIIDPIDGTTNFVHGYPFFSISIALAHHGEVVAGVIYDPMHDEMFVGEKGEGAYLKRRRLKVSQEQRLADGLVATDFPSTMNTGWHPQKVMGIVPRVRNLRISGSAALNLAYVAAGRLSGFWDPNLNAWDTAAGILLVQEAGGRVSDLGGNPYSLTVRDVVATNGHIHDELLGYLKE
jgi:myo-inositol-1(or 4)-monophosphatase